MALDWWDLGDRWRERHATLAHGDLVRVAAEFARDADVAPSTLRACKTAVETVIAMQHEGVVDEPSRRKLTRLPLKAIGALQRAARHGPAELAWLLERLLAPAPPDGRELIAIEGEMRARSRPVDGPEANAHAYRLLTGPFRRGALEAIRRERATRGERTYLPTSPKLIGPFAVDGLAMRGDRKAYTGYRLLAATAGATVRPRLAEALPAALGAARAVDAHVLVAQARTDADELAARVGRVGPCGVGVAWFDPGHGLITCLDAVRQGRPDLAARHAEELGACFPDPEADVDDAG